MEKFLTKVFTKLGENNKALYSVITIAAFKGVFRPLFTMLDKKTEPETKKYTAIREGLTEVIAAGVYIGVDKAVSSLAKPLTKNCPNNIGKVKNALSFLGVCTSAAVLIPATCNVAIKPVMNAIKKGNQKKTLTTYPNTQMKCSSGLKV